MAQSEAPGKEMTGKKMAGLIVGIILGVCTLIVITISIFYMVWEPSPAKEIETIETQSSFLPSEQSFKLLL